jgi:HD-GYP domain-containing protein (c-di-GMP phosphodiesterase class II)
MPMSEDFNINQVNQHYLDKVMDLSEQMDVEASEDIFDARGMKLVAKGAKISRNLQEKLILHKLSKPLESSIAIDGGVKIDTVIEEAQRLAETNGPMGAILKTAGQGGLSPFQILKQTRFGSSMGLMLTITERGGATALAHSVIVSMASICLAKRIGMGEKDQTIVALAGLLHDIGELYIEPEYLSSKRRLLPHEWRHVIVHPRIGEMLIKELEKFPPEVALAVSEHHERFNGAGYPRQKAGKNLSAYGQIISVAEMMSGVFMREDSPLERAELALKIMPGEHAHELVSIVSSALLATRQGQPKIADSISPKEMQERLRLLSDNIDNVMRLSDELAASGSLQSPAARKLLESAVFMTQIIKRAFTSTGLDSYLHENSTLLGELSSEDSHVLQFEVSVASKEIQWRIRDIARNIALQSASFSSSEAEAFQPLIQMLDEGR